MSLAPGQVVDRYEIMSELGHGGMSDSYRARDRESGENVVIKVPLSNRLDDAAGRYQREAEIGRRLHHPNVQHVIGTGRLPDGTPYLALEYVEGEALRVYLTAHAPLDPWRALQLAQQVGAALAACHEQGIVHRDVKPENLLITASGQLKLLDFGIALPKGEHRMGWNRLGGTAGTPDYMAPEQARGQPGDARSDVYALGALLYEMLSGRPPFAGDNALAVMHQRNDREAQRVTEHAPGTPAPLDAIVARALRRDPARRYPSMAALMVDLGRLREPHPSHGPASCAPPGSTATRAPMSTRSSRTGGPPSLPTGERPTRKGKLRAALRAAGGAVAHLIQGGQVGS